MLTRRHIRINVFHSLYGYSQRSEKNMASSIKDLKTNLDSIFDLYLYDLRALLQFYYAAQDQIEAKKNKHLPSKEDLNPNTRFVDNRVLSLLDNNKALTELFEARNIKWGEHKDALKKLYKEFILTEEYNRYVSAPSSIGQDKKIVKFIYSFFLANNEDIHSIYEDMNMNWADDFDAAQMMVVKTFKVLMDVNGTTVSKVNFNPQELASIEKNNTLPKRFNPENQTVTLNLFKDKSDKEFGPQLFTKTLNHSEEFEKRVTEKTANWDADRIALVDNILMKMALTELVAFPDIPVKVTLNEYIELSKMYSTQKSSQFINGVLDKISSDLKKEGKIKKIGRGLL